MVIQPKIRGFICTTAHPVGCAHQVEKQIAYVKQQHPIVGPKKALVIGASTGYGLSSRIVTTFGAGADTIGVYFERPAADNRTATAGWYNTAAFTSAAERAGYRTFNINGDAFSNEIKQQTIDLIRTEFGQVDLVVYSVAAPRRTHPQTGETFTSVLKPIGKPFTNKTVNVQSGEVTQITIEPATEEEIQNTVAVMGGEDWEMWIQALTEAGVLAHNAVTIAYSYIGPELTHAVYREGTIGRAKDDLEATALRLNSTLSTNGGKAYVSVNKAVVTQSSSAIPVVPLYISLLFQVMKEKGLHEGTIEQMYRLFADRLYGERETLVDARGRVRVDELEMRDDVQRAVAELWSKVDSNSLAALSDIEGYRTDFLKLFGFGDDAVDYSTDVNPDVEIK